ncbi:MAG: oligosaccharide flippase family protein [Lachnospiraceae bacterium]|nr:oligosaccharide flippase family protein [Lachnospiraceae bacterium]
MRLERVKNTKRNMFYGVLSKIVSIFLPFIVRTVLIKEIGIEYLGIKSLFSSILAVLSLAELGFSNAIVYSMYKPIAEEDNDTICALLNFYKTVYRIIGLLILGVGMVIIPFLPYLVKGEYPTDINIIVVYLIYLGNTVLSYFMYAYLSSLLNAYQREDLISKINIVVSGLLNISQIIIICLTKNYYLYAILMVVFTIVNNIRIAFVAKKMYPQYKCQGKLSKELFEDIKKRLIGLVINKLCIVSRNSFDSIFISVFLGLTINAVYGNYYYIITSVTAFLTIIVSSITAGVGNSVVIESEEKNYTDMNRLNFVYMWLSGWATISMLCLYQNFMYLWVGKELMFSLPVVILLCIYFYVLKMGDIRSVYVQVNGLWWENRYRAIIESVSNIVLNYILAKYFGVVGIIVATLITLFLVNFCYGSTIVFKYYFIKQNASIYFIQHFQYVFITVGIGLVTYLVCGLIGDTSLITLILRGGICIIIPNILYFLVYWNLNFSRNSIKWMIDKVIEKK